MTDIDIAARRFRRRKQTATNVVIDDFDRRVRIDFETGCWIWKRGRAGHGYGDVSVMGVTKLAHRLFYETLIGPIPPHLELDHLCRRCDCVNPKHIEAVTAKTNTLRGVGPTAINSRKVWRLRYEIYQRMNPGGKTTMNPEIERVASICHEANRALCRAFGDHSQQAALDAAKEQGDG